MNRILNAHKGYKAVIPSKLSVVGTVVKETLQYIQKYYCSIDESTIFELKVILNELIVNAIKHGNLHDSSKLVKIHAGFTEEGYVTIAIEDEGEGGNFDCYLTARRNTYSNDEVCNISECGRGILIAKNLCNSLKYNEKGNIVFVKKRL